MTPTRSDFEKAIAPYETAGGLFTKKDMYFAARWVAEYLASYKRELYPNEILELASELQ